MQDARIWNGQKWFKIELTGDILNMEINLIFSLHI